MSTSRSAWSMRFSACLRALDMDLMVLQALKIGATLYEHSSHLSPEDAAALYAADHAQEYPHSDSWGAAVNVGSRKSLVWVAALLLAACGLIGLVMVIRTDDIPWPLLGLVAFVLIGRYIHSTASEGRYPWTTRLKVG